MKQSEFPSPEESVLTPRRVPDEPSHTTRTTRSYPFSDRLIIYSRPPDPAATITTLLPASTWQIKAREIRERLHYPGRWRLTLRTVADPDGLSCRLIPASCRIKVRSSLVITNRRVRRLWRRYGNYDVGGERMYTEKDGGGEGRFVGARAEGERDERDAQGDETNGSNIAAQNSQSNPTKQITPNFPGNSYARCPFALHSRQVRSKASFRAPRYRARNVSSHDVRTSGASFPPSTWPFHRRPGLCMRARVCVCIVQLVWRSDAFDHAAIAIEVDARVTNASKCMARGGRVNAATRSRFQPFRQFDIWHLDVGRRPCTVDCEGVDGSVWIFLYIFPFWMTG